LGYTTPAILNALSNIAVSLGSACHSGSTTISPVLKAMGIIESEIAATIRFSFGRFTTQNEIDVVLENLSCVAETE
jgi:cysteine desulfurase